MPLLIASISSNASFPRCAGDRGGTAIGRIV
jgi:hypothetical protein